ncbi:hypothetical protein MRX96_057958 [Rhipicephalus microplus]
MNVRQPNTRQNVEEQACLSRSGPPLANTCTLAYDGRRPITRSFPPHHLPPPGGGRARRHQTPPPGQGWPGRPGEATPPTLRTNYGGPPSPSPVSPPFSAVADPRGPLLGPGGRRAGRVRGAAGARKQALPGSSLGPDQAQQASGLLDSPTVIALEERACARRRSTPLDTLVAAPLPPPLSPLPRKARRGRKTSSTRAPPEQSAFSAQ